ncbi:MAG TPA: hypothetical protein VGG72_23515 [Bryobacteraceae bacterium]|jgi:hypothetical protein
MKIAKRADGGDDYILPETRLTHAALVIGGFTESSLAPQIPADDSAATLGAPAHERGPAAVVRSAIDGKLLSSAADRILTES